jgi:hypothetical protein
MSEWNRRDREQGQTRYGHDEPRRRGAGADPEGGRLGDQRNFAEGGSWYEEDYPGAGEQSDRGKRRVGYGPSDQGYVRNQYGGQGYGEGGYGRGGQYKAGGQYGASDRTYAGDAGYGGSQPGGWDRSYENAGRPVDPYYGGQSYGAQSYDRPSYGRARTGGSDFGQNERLQRVSDGEADRGHFFGGGMNRGGGEHRGRGPKNYTRSDERIREDVNDRLSDDSWLDASEIDVQVTSCEVTLAGTVCSRDDKRRAEEVAEQVSGVKHVQNNLRIQPAATGQTSQGQGQATGQGSTTTTGRPSNVQ